MQSAKIARLTAEVLNDKKAEKIEVLKVDELTIIADYFVICTANSTTQVKALTDAVLEKAGESGIKPSRVEGQQSSLWVLLDFDSVIVHIFKSDVRDFYNLDRLWGDAKHEKYEFLNN